MWRNIKDMITYCRILWGCYDCIERTDSFVLAFGLVESWIVKRSLARYSIVAYWQSHTRVAHLISYSLVNTKSRAFIKFIATKFSCFVSITVALYEGLKTLQYSFEQFSQLRQTLLKGLRKNNLIYPSLTPLVGLQRSGRPRYYTDIPTCDSFSSGEVIKGLEISHQNGQCAFTYRQRQRM